MPGPPGPPAVPFAAPPPGAPQPPVYGPPVAGASQSPVAISYPPSPPPFSTQTCKAIYTQPATLDGIQVSPVCPDDSYQLLGDICYAACANGSEPAANGTACAEDCPGGYVASDTLCVPSPECHWGFTLLQLSNGTEVCITACPPSYNSTDLTECVETCPPGSFPTPDGIYCSSLKGVLTLRQLIPRTIVAPVPVRPRKLVPRESVAPQCASAGQVVVDGLCVAQCNSASYTLSFDPGDNVVMCTLPACPFGSAFCGTYCMERSMALRLEAVCDAVGQALDNMGNDEGCGGVCYC